MMITLKQAVALGVVVLLAGGCTRPVLKQDIPVTTNPLGARIYANGQLMGTTPASVPLERNRSHILTLLKDNYRQEDVVIERRYQKDRVYLKAIQSGINSGLFFKNPAMGVQSSMSAMSDQEETGEAYILTPPAVTVTLAPLSAPPGTPPGARTPAATQPVSRGPSAAEAEAPSMNRGELAREVLKIGAGAALTQARPLEKKVETSSSERRYVTPDGTRVHEKSSTSVGVGINPAGLVDALDLLFK
ncbi:MAG: PEGA domain-containing protein [Syntrophales bacterium]